MAAENLDRAIHDTVRYFNLFDQPVTAVQIWQLLIGADKKKNDLKLDRIRDCLQHSHYLKEKLGSRWGYYFLSGRDYLVAERLARYRQSQMKWKITRRVVRFLQYAPFVRMIAMSGSLSQGNTRPTSDLDLFIVASRGRIWLARLELLLLTQLLGRRRRYWDQKAPDRVCLNHYITDRSLLISPDIRNLYTAVLYRLLIPLTGQSVYLEFWKCNREWINRYMRNDRPLCWLPARQTVVAGSLGGRVKKTAESIFREPMFDWLERLSEKVQRRAIARHTVPGQSGRVAVSDAELAFHPDTKVPRLLDRFEQRQLI